MPRWTVVVATLLVAAVPANARVAPAADCGEPVAYVSPDSVVAAPAQPKTGQLVTYRVDLDPAYLQPGTLIFTVTDPSDQKRQLQPSSADGLSITYTPTIPGRYSVDAAWQGKNCNNPEQFGDGSASLNHQVDGEARMSASAVPGYVKPFGVKAARVVPKHCTDATVDPSRKNRAGTGVWVGYGPGARCPQVFAFHESLSRIRSLLIGRSKHAKVGRMTIGGRSVTAIGLDFVWRQGEVTYDVRAKSDAGIKRFIASFR